ncbi:aryl-alcohol dehydrogenase-like predicted oxidoreductase [Saccharothrix tamanrassetensis]|uniref:Aryl-alcohol dehydrogenase-like predicted oxidoreductase n=1 Tax=Saccharothrix tamanrassetensis TaxID=1051531 RepID=A0A841CA98_9PSEU|nr:aldo/keto reductase [Saccharothrix tamanrassetensis]MBB5954111.1 aryl-alcohol dehydrogenase-like predicted oxidoreductase [Saccharothrix tamanrassetensis]
MPDFALGLAALGRPAYINLGREHALPANRDVDAMRAACHAVLDAAYAAGVRRVDAARSYGRAEEFLAQWLAGRGHRDVRVSSKWGYEYVADWQPAARTHEVKEHSHARFTRQWAETEALLGNHLELYKVHSLTDDSPLFGDLELLAALGKLRDSGVRLGFSTSGPRQADTVRRALDLEMEGRRLFEAVQSTWNVLEPSVGPTLAWAHESGAEVFVKEGMANGRLAVDPPALVRELAAKHDVGPDAIALAAVRAQPWADVVLSGAASVDQLHANLRAHEVDLAPDELDLAEDPWEYWATRAALPWG